jgi:hypothetical protein
MPHIELSAPQRGAPLLPQVKSLTRSSCQPLSVTGPRRLTSLPPPVRRAGVWSMRRPRLPLRKVFLVYSIQVPFPGEEGLVETVVLLFRTSVPAFLRR